MATEHKVTVKSSGGDYTSLNAALTANCGLASKDLVAQDKYVVIECYPMEDTTAVTISGWSTDSTRNITIKTPSSNRHGGKWNTGVYRLKVAGSVINCSAAYTVIDGLQVEHAASGQWAFGIYTSASTTVRRVIVRRSPGSGAPANSVGMGAAVNNSNNSVFEYCIVYGLGNTGNAGIQTEQGANLVLRNCTVYGCTTGYRFVSGTLSATNCIATGGTTCFTGSITGSHNVSSDATAPGTNALTGSTPTFVNITSGSEDFHILNANAYAGVDPGSSSAFDIDYEAITSWKRGADAQSVAVITIPANANYKVKHKKTVWTPKDRLDKKQATTGLPAWSHGNDNFTKLLISDSLADSSLGFPVHPYMPVTGYFDGTGDYLSIPNHSDFNFGTGDFTVEGWFYNPTANTTPKVLFSLTSTTNGLGFLIGCDNGVSNQIAVHISSIDSDWDIVSNSSQGFYNASTWNHIAVSRNGNNFHVFVNGNQTNTFTSALSIYFPPSALLFGARTSPSIIQHFAGNLVDWRVSKGIARYTSNFTVPTSPLVADQYTKLLLPMNEGLKPVAYDSLGRQVVATGTTTAPKTFNKLPIDDVAAYFDGTGDYLSTSQHSDFSLAVNEDFTLEGWVKFNSLGDYQVIFSTTNQTTNNGTGLSLDIAASRLRFVVSNNASGTTFILGGTNILAANTWYYVAVRRSSSTVTLWVNDTLDATGTWGGASAPGQGPFLGVFGLGYSVSPFGGYMADIRFSKGIARTISVPTAPLDADSYTKLLLHMDTVGTAFVDSSSSPKSITASGDVRQYVCQPGTTKALYFDGTANSSVTSPVSNDWDFTGDFTLEGWFNLPSGRANDGLITCYQTDTTGWELYISGSGNLTWYSGSEGASHNIQTAYPVSQWFHAAISRVGNTIYAFVNGILKNSWTFANTISSAGKLFYVGNGQGFLSGTCAWVHVVNGTGLYIGNFTPPTLPSINSNSRVILVAGENATTFNDFSPYTKTITTNGDAKQTNKLLTNTGVTLVSDSTCPISGRVMSFNGSSSVLTYPTGLLDYTKDFTIDAWYYKTANPAANGASIFEHNDNNSSGPMVFIMQNTNGNIYASIYMSGGCNYYWVSNTTLTNGAWYHIAFIRKDNNTYFFINGILQTMSTNTIGTFTNPTSQPFSGKNQPTNGWLNGKICQLRLSQFARWTSNFTVPKLNYLAS